MLRWIDIIRYSDLGNPAPDRVVKKTDEQWRDQLTDEQYQITRLKGTERSFSSEMCHLFEPGIYACVCCDTLLFNANEKFDSGTGWPSFTQPIKENAIAYFSESTHGMRRIEALCNTCQAHLGHVFQDGPEPSGLRYCINAISLKKVATTLEKATFGGGCFWCTETIYLQLKGVNTVESGYSDGEFVNPTYKEVCTGNSGHAEVVQISFDPREISYQDLLKIHLSTHTPPTLNQQGADKGTQYRSIILTHNEEQQSIAEQVLLEMETVYEQPIVTAIKPFKAFFKAEEYHQDYYKNNSAEPYCQAVIAPKLSSFRQLFKNKIK
jgi:peptide methionine sulfoxide reductase msrA/msrB